MTFYLPRFQGHAFLRTILKSRGKMMAKIMLRLFDDPRVDFIATLQGPFAKNTEIGVKGDAVFRWQRDPEDPNTFVDIKMSNLDDTLRLRSCALYP